MDQKTNSLIIWAPRVMAIFLALFIAVFSLDVFDGTSDIWRVLGGFVIHNIPSMVLAVVIWAAWKREWLGAVVFVLLGMAYMLWNLDAHWSVHAVITAPTILTGLLYLLAWRSRHGLKLAH